MKKLILGAALVLVLAVTSIAAQTLTVWDFKYSEVNAGGSQAPMKANDAALRRRIPVSRSSTSPSRPMLRSTIK